MNGIIFYYLSEFYPLILGIIIFFGLKSMKLLKHRTRIRLENHPSAYNLGPDLQVPKTQALNCIDIYPSINVRNIDFLKPYKGSRLSLFNGYFTDSSEPRAAAYQMMICDSLTINGKSTIGVKSNKTAYDFGFSKFGILDMENSENINIGKSNAMNAIKLFAPNKEKFLSSTIKSGKSAFLIYRIAGYGIEIV